MKTCSYCGQDVTAKQASIAVSNTDGVGRRHVLAWHVPCCRIDPVYPDVCGAPRIPESALLVIKARRADRATRAGRE